MSRGGDEDEEGLISALPSSVLLYMLGFLGPKDLAIASATCRAWHQLCTQDSQLRWKAFFGERWRSSSVAGSVRWCSAFSSKDHLYGHRQGVRACKLLPSQGLLATGSLDKTVRLWDLNTGLPLSVSRPHGGTVRCVALDDALLCSGSVDYTIRVYAADDGSHMGGTSSGDEAAVTPFSAAAPPVSSSSGPPLFDLSAPTITLTDHTGPVSSLCLTEHALYSGSWDCTVRTYTRHNPRQLALASVLTYNDWVASVAARGKHLLVAAGSDVFCHDQATGQVVRRFQNLHEGNITGVEGTQNSKMLFTAAGEGLVMAHDLRMKNPSMVVWHHNACVQGLAFEDPWLASASADGTVLMVNTEVALQRGSAPRALGPNCRQLQASGPAYCVDIADQRIACGSESSTVRVWDFTRARESADRAAKAREAREAAAAAGRARTAGAGGGQAGKGPRAGGQGHWHVRGQGRGKGQGQQGQEQAPCASPALLPAEEVGSLVQGPVVTGAGVAQGSGQVAVAVAPAALGAGAGPSAPPLAAAASAAAGAPRGHGCHGHHRGRGGRPRSGKQGTHPGGQHSPVQPKQQRQQQQQQAQLPPPSPQQKQQQQLGGVQRQQGRGPEKQR